MESFLILKARGAPMECFPTQIAPAGLPWRDSDRILHPWGTRWAPAGYSEWETSMEGPRGPNGYPLGPRGGMGFPRGAPLDLPRGIHGGPWGPRGVAMDVQLLFISFNSIFNGLGHF